MDDLREKFERQKREFFSGLTLYERRTKIKLMQSIIVFLLMSLILIFNVNQFYNINPPVGYFVLIIVLFTIVFQLSYLIYIRKPNTLDYTQKEKDVKKLYKANSILYNVLSILVVLLIVQMFLISRGTVTRTSMEPNYSDGDNIWIYHFNVEYNRFDVVVFDVSSPADNFMKRIIGLPGDTVTIKEGSVYVNGILVDDPTFELKENSTFCESDTYKDGSVECSWVIPENRYFVLGDNRETSLDSRHFGLLHRDQFFGKVIYNNSKTD